MRKKTISISITIVVFFALMAGLAFFSFKDHFVLPTAKKSWYAVYLSNNQAYFGHISKINDSEMVLDDVFSLQAFDEPAEQSTSEHFSLTPAAKQTFKLVKRGTDTTVTSDHSLTINRSNILYWEKLTSEAQVVKLIEEVK